MFDDYYGLTGKPFRLTPDPASFFRSATHRKALAYLAYGLAQGEGFIVITGEKGSGKSTLVAHLAGTIDPQQLTVAQIVTTKRHAEEIIPLAAQSFGLGNERCDKDSALSAIKEFLLGEARAGRRCLLIVDEAQNLSVAALEDLLALSNFQHGARAQLPIALLGQPELRATLHGQAALEPLRRRVTAEQRLEPLERAEIEPYIVHRLERAGWSGVPQFDQRVFAELHEASAGIPLRINQITGRLLRLGAVEGRSRIDAMMLKAVLDELAAERAFAAEPLGAGPATTLPPPSGQAQQVDHATFVAALAERDRQIAELQQALVELSSLRGAAGAGPLGSPMEALEALGVQVAALEARTGEQDRALRRTLGMLIEWIERESEPSRAA